MRSRRRRERIAENFVPVRGVAVHTVEIDGEAVLLDEASARLHLLNTTGALVWACFDGSSSIADIVSDLSDETGAPYETVLADTVAVTRKLGDEGLLANVEPARSQEVAAHEPDAPADPRFVVEPRSPCFEEILRLGVVISMTVRVGERLIGVRTDDEEWGARLRTLFDGFLETDVEAPGNLTLRRGAREGRTRQFHTLCRVGSPVMRTASTGRLFRATLAHLDAYDKPPTEVARLRARLLVHDDRAVLVSFDFNNAVERIERRLERLGWQVADVPTAPIDRSRLDVTLWAPRLAVDPDALAAIDREDPPERREFPIREIQLPVAAVLCSAQFEHGEASPARRLAALAPLVTDRAGSSSPEDLDLLARLAAETRVVLHSTFTDAQLLDVFRELG